MFFEVHTKAPYVYVLDSLFFTNLCGKWLYGSAKSRRPCEL